jgi:drug/metabolite transporter (DMT)-like permease
MRELLGVGAAVLSSAIGGTAVAATRYVVHATDPLTLGALRFGIGALLLVPLALASGGHLPERRDWPGIAWLGVLFFAVFPVLFNASLAYTTAARGALALSTLPLLTLIVARLFGHEDLTGRKAAGVLVAMTGAAVALWSGLGTAPPGAWRGDLLMAAAALCMAVYSIWSRPLIARCGALMFPAMAMAIGAAVLSGAVLILGGFSAISSFAVQHWLAVVYLAAVGSAFVFFLWSFALARTTPTRVAVSVTVNPVAAAIVGALLLAEPVSADVLVGLVAVVMGISLAIMGGEIGRR